MFIHFWQPRELLTTSLYEKDMEKDNLLLWVGCLKEMNLILIKLFSSKGTFQIAAFYFQLTEMATILMKTVKKNDLHTCVT